MTFANEKLLVDRLLSLLQSQATFCGPTEIFRLGNSPARSCAVGPSVHLLRDPSLDLPGPQISNSPLRTAIVTAWVLSLACSLSMMFLMWKLTVVSEIAS